MVPPAVSTKEPAKQKGAKAFKDAFSKSNVEAHLSAVRHKILVKATAVASELGMKPKKD